MRALVVLTHPPLEEGSAAGRCAVALIRGLRLHGVDVTALAADLGPTGGAQPPPDLGVEIIEIDTSPSWSMRAGRYLAPAALLGKGEFAARVRTLSAGADVVHLDEVHAAAAGRGLSTPTVTHLHYLARRDRPLELPVGAAARDGLELRRAERRVAREAAHLVSNSPEMVGALRRLGGRDITLMPLGLDAGGYIPAAAAAAPVAGLIGSAAWPPTADAVRRLLTTVWPLVLLRRPDAVLRLAGHGMARDRFGDLPVHPGVEWTGPVESAQDFLRSLAVLLYPVGRGSGTKVKVLEAMALGVPVVTTAPGAEGVLPNDGVMVVDDDAGLALAAASLLGDVERRGALGAAARAAFDVHHAPAPATLPLVALFERLTRARGD